MKNIILIIFQLVCFYAITACEREFPYEIESVTPPELHVIVKYSDNQPAVNARVRLFDSLDDFIAGNPDLASRQTDDAGLAVFTEEQLRSPGIFYVSASLGMLDNSNSSYITPYILLNDGHTKFFTWIE